MDKMPQEILDMIGLSLDPGHLAILSRACKLYHWIFNHLLYLHDAQFRNSSAVFKAIDKCTRTEAVIGALTAANKAGANFRTERIGTIRNISPRRNGYFADPNATTKQNIIITPLHLAAEKGLNDVVCFLLDNSVPVDGVPERSSAGVNWTALFVAIYHRQASTVRLLIERGASLAPKGYVCNSLRLAVAANLEDIVVYLVGDRGLDVNAADKNGDTLLIYAILSPNTKISMITLLLKLGADPNRPTRRASELVTPLRLACRFNFYAALALLDGGADARGHVNICGWAVPNPPGPLEYALRAEVKNQKGRARKTKEDMVQKLLRSGADPNEVVTIADREVPLLFAMVHLNKELEVEYLLQGGANIEKQDSEGYTTLTHALWNNPKMARLLFEHGAKPQDIAIDALLRKVLTLPPLSQPNELRRALCRYPSILQRYKVVYDYCFRVPPEGRSRAANEFLVGSPLFLVRLAEKLTWGQICSRKTYPLQNLLEKYRAGIEVED